MREIEGDSGNDEQRDIEGDTEMEEEGDEEMELDLCDRYDITGTQKEKNVRIEIHRHKDYG